MSDRALLWLSALELGKLIAKRSVSSVEITRLYLRELDTRGRALNALAELTPEIALKQAAQADREVKAGKIRSPLHGVPYGAKDLLATRGIPTRWGSPAHANQVFNYDATVVTRLREAGAVLVAKLAMVELAGGVGYEFAAASITGPCKNPYDDTRWAGGSSSGSGAAVGGGMVGFAIGTETWGSITVPAAFCNVSGLRPTYGRVPRTGAMALCWTMDKIGPMARTAEDCLAILRVIAGHDPRDPSSSTEKFGPSLPDRTPLRARLGLLPTEYAKNKAPEAQKHFKSAISVLQGLGCTSDKVILPNFPYDAAAGTIVNVEGAASFEGLVRSAKLDLLADNSQKAGLIAALAIPGSDYLRALRIRKLAGPAAVKVFDKFDALVAPTLLKGAPPWKMSLNEGFANMGGNGGPGNLLGWPSISVPMGMDADGLPLGLEIIGAPYQEAAILKIAMAFQKATPHHRIAPKA